MEGSPFGFSPGLGDRALALGGSLERILRGAVRRLRQGRGLLERPEQSRLWSSRPAAEQAGAEPGGGALVYFAAVPWDYRFQRPQQLARALHQLGHPVLYVEAFERQHLQPRLRQRRQPGAPWVVKLRVPGRPDPYRTYLDGAAAPALAAQLARDLRWRLDAVVVQLPFWWQVGRELRDRLGVPLVYDRIDLHAGFPDVPQLVNFAEEGLLRDADLVTASSSSLLPAGSSRFGRCVSLVPNAVAVEDFPLAPAPPAGGVAIGYVGALGPWFDAPAVAGAAKAHPGWRFELAGRVECEEVAALAELPNVRLLGEIPYSAVPAFLGRLHAALIPFRDLPLTRAVDPVKLYESLAVGLPVVARALPGVAPWEEPLVHRYRQPGELAGCLETALAAGDEALRRRRREAVARHTWRARAELLLAQLASVRASPRDVAR